MSIIESNIIYIKEEILDNEEFEEVGMDFVKDEIISEEMEFVDIKLETATNERKDPIREKVSSKCKIEEEFQPPLSKRASTDGRWSTSLKKTNTSNFYKKAPLSRIAELIAEDASSDDDVPITIELDSDAEIMDSNLNMYLHEDMANFNETEDPYSVQPEPHSAESPATTSTAKKRKRDHTPWRLVTEEFSQTEMPEWKGELPNVEKICSPIDYFRYFLDSEILEYIVKQSNLYAIQRNPSKPLNLDRNELEQFIGSVILMSLTKISKVRLYWSNDFFLAAVAKYFSRNRWEFIKTCLHFNDNDKMLERGHPNFDPMFKIRPLLTHLQKKFTQIPAPQMMCVDEQLVPFKGRAQEKQYIPSKPHKWGYKIFALCDAAGILYDFEVYTGKILPVAGEPDLGASSNAVLHMARSIPEGMNTLLYFDNWFTSIPLIVHLAKKNIYCLATVRINRVPGISSVITSDKELLKRGRGSYIEACSTIDCVDIRLVKWADNKCVNLVSTFSSANPLGSCKRFDRKQKKTVEIQCPSIVQTYNSFMGGVDLMDSLISLYRISLRSKKNYMKLVFHFLDVSVVNSWLIYKRECYSLDVPKEDRLNLQQFKHSIAQALLLQRKPQHTATKLGRPKRSIDSLHLEKKRLGNRTSSIPDESIRKD